jgi:hypothetical protein
MENNFPSYLEFISLLQKLYPEDYHPELFLKWKDEEGDQITVSSQPEWEHLLHSVKEQPIKLYIAQGIQPYFKDGPPAVPVRFYEENKQEIKEEPEMLKRLQNSIPKCLQHLFEGDRILPYDLPNWIKEAVQIKRIPIIGNEVDLDIDIKKLFNAMHTQALKLLSDAKNLPLVQEAKVILQDMLTIIPKHAVTLYNLSCAEALLGNTKDALNTLRSAIFDGGYNNVEHMEKDEDLASIRDTQEFKQLVSTLKHQPQEDMDEEKSEILKDWENVAMEEESPSSPSPPIQPTVSVGEKKWATSIEELKSMGFGQSTEYFGPRCVVLLEKYKGDINSVIDELVLQ